MPVVNKSDVEEHVDRQEVLECEVKGSLDASNHAHVSERFARGSADGRCDTSSGVTPTAENIVDEGSGPGTLRATEGSDLLEAEMALPTRMEPVFGSVTQKKWYQHSATHPTALTANQ